LDVRWATTIL